ncbi:MAG: hypothetical protein ACQKBT_10695 [Puniceicoccales bacterium]
MKRYSFQWEPQKLTIVLRGVITFEDVVELCDARIADPRFDSIQHILNDLRELEGIDASKSDIRAALIYANQSRHFGRRTRVMVSFVATDPGLRSHVLEFLAHANQQDHTWIRELFYSVEEADAWAAQGLKSR